ncbi:hypothetical protein K493DRAFT_286679 [Basidiobolus meristosporus CBS 931.73]|uniref:Uncharacterized protein n=1 Tax=Basidiobolus meristosporus CBS 931.73 TaxID=1314790 RepID=A0A1Y1Y0L5_9FUNG|nr:hypothetical protein K493DRAFT_286679 [Basidiobolus meristosporus CBS 931.73]|eukprot:ORX91518.1 hypothetical protein K493DRAFT_286679 [Basidiobolus meristosporus CBS 931.73]
MSELQLFFITLPIVILVLFLVRRVLIKRGYRRLGTGTFLEDLENGLSSETFDILPNIEGGDSRPGLDSEEIHRIMKKHGCTFDEARVIRQQLKFKNNNIDPATGMPLDPKAVVFS